MAGNPEYPRRSEEKECIVYSAFFVEVCMVFSGKNLLRIMLYVAVLLPAALGFATEPSLYFEENFSGNTLDLTKWNSSPEQGIRWCGEQQNGLSPGKWISMASSSCNATLQPPPYGRVDVGGGVVQVGPANAHVFPYFFTALPNESSPFPATGDFVLQIRLRHDYIGGAGNGVYIRYWQKSKPEGENPPLTTDARVFSIWSDQTSSRIGLMGQTVSYPDIPGKFKVYRLEYLGGVYSAFIDDQLVAGPVESSVRPNVIWVGNPLVLWWVSSGQAGWSEFTIDSIQVHQPATAGAAQIRND